MTRAFSHRLGRAAALLAIAVAAAALLPAGASASAAAAPRPLSVVTQARCTATDATTSFLAIGAPLLDWREQLVFDGIGGLWVSRLERNVVERYDPAGHVNARIPLTGPGGLALGPDGLVYVNSQSRTGGLGSVYRFDPRLAHPVPRLFVSGLPGVNGSVFDAAGNLYVSTEGAAPSVLRIRPDGTRDEAWENAASFYGANGLEVVGGELYAAISFDQRSPIEVVPIDDPAARHTAAELSLGVVSREPMVYPNPDTAEPVLVKGLDDLVLGPDGNLYIAAFASGQVVRWNPRDGRACIVVSGLILPTAVRFPVSFAGFSPSRDLLVTEAAGDVVRVHLPAPV